MYDLVIRNGMLVDPAQGLSEKRDLAIQAGRIVSVAEEIAPDSAWDCLDASGHLVTPGLIDIHVHVYPGVSHYGVEPDATCLARGVTTACDAGSSGADTFDGLRRYVIDVSETRLFAFLNISAIGMVDPLDNELEDLRLASPERAIAVVERNRDVIQGIKARLSRRHAGNNDLEPLRLARRAAEAVGMPMMVHVGDTASPLEAILAELRPGDLVTHCYHGRAHGILDAHGSVRPEVAEAARKGIIFDVGHGVGSFSFAVAKSALAQGLAPATISSDLHRYNVHGPVFDLATTLSKFLLLGLPLDAVLAKATSVPAGLLGLADRLGSLREGYLADITVFKLAEGEFEFEDSLKQRKVGRQKLEPAAVIRRGRIYRSALRVERQIGSRY